jgi:DNA-3-methyladenine glycosylase II
MDSTAVSHILKGDHHMARLIQRIGPLNFIPAKERTLYAALTKSVIGQLLSRSAAKAILTRLTDQLPSGHLLIPAEVLKLPESILRSAGLSSTKSATVMDRAERAVEGMVPGPARLQEMSDDKIIQEIITIKGIGRWTMEMLLIFTLGRQDVLPAGDLGNGDNGTMNGRRGYPAFPRKGEAGRPSLLYKLPSG